MFATVHVIKLTIAQGWTLKITLTTLEMVTLSIKISMSLEITIAIRIKS